MRLPRMTTRRLMAIVAVVAIAMGSLQLWGLRKEYLGLANEYEYSEWRARNVLNARPPGYEPAPEFLENAAKDVEWHSLMRQKYERAARYPWLPVAPDPPEPR